MKKKLSILLTVILITVFLIPSGALAMENKDLESAITTAKSLLDIGDDYDTFSYSISKQDDRTVYNLSWSDSKQKLGEINAGIDSTGRLLNYYFYKQSTERSTSKLPAVNKSDALKASNDFIKKVNSSVFDKIKYQDDDTFMYIGDTYYHFSYDRIENGVIFPANTVNVSVDNKTGSVMNYNCNWTDGLTFPDLSGKISLSEAQNIFTEKLGLDLIYKLNYDKGESKPYLVYSIMNNNKCIDAKTGEVIALGNIYYSSDKAEMAKTADSGQGAANTVRLSPEERKAVDNAANLISEKTAEDTARKIMELDDGYRLESINLYKVWQTKDDYIWNMQFSKQENDGDKAGYYSASASVDAKTGEITDFYRSYPGNNDDPVVYDKDQSIKLASDFIKSLQPDKASQVEYTTWNDSPVKPLDDGQMPRNLSFRFTRLANGVYFPDNGFNVNVDTVTGKVISYSYTWFKDALPKPDNVIASSKAHEILYKNIGLQLQYIADYSQETNGKVIMPSPGRSTKPDIKLVYSLSSTKPANIDAVTGDILDYSGNPYTERTIAEYSDISGNSAENAIKVLSQFGISLPGNEFKPNQIINQKDFLYLLARCLGWYSDYEDTDSFTDSLYSYLTGSGVVKDGERNPSSTVTRQEASRFIVRALNYDRVAELKDLFSLPFKDASSVSSSYRGYTAIAYGMGIMEDYDGYFKPTGSMTRADAAESLFNLLNVGF